MDCICPPLQKGRGAYPFTRVTIFTYAKLEAELPRIYELVISSRGAFHPDPHIIFEHLRIKRR